MASPTPTMTDRRGGAPLTRGSSGSCAPETARRASTPLLPMGPPRFIVASLLSTAMSLALLTGLIGASVEPAIANLVATSITAVAGYLLNRHWVWERREGAMRSRELAVFWGLALAGLALSTLAVSLADAWADAAGASSGEVTAAAVAANWTAFLSLAVLKFLISRRLFAPDPEPVDARALEVRGRL
jgi:putative flippase GtrA